MNEFDIAIVGMSCRLPGARDLDEFWRNLAGGVESIARLSDQEILDSGAASRHLQDPNYVRAAPVLEDPDYFDPAFFGYSPTEARSMDPQQRILLELAHEALEHAACDPDRFPGRIGVFAGSAFNTYYAAAGLNRRFVEEYIPTLIGSDKDFLATRISYKLNLKGPSITVQTACSTSLVAIHLARQSLLSLESDIALAGAISIRVPHRAGYIADAGGVVSPDGHVRAFDAAANGTVFGSGGGVLVLKRLKDAVADGDTIHAVIKGTAVNNDGTEKAGYTAPSVNGQADAVIEALANAGVEADTISYVEAHGSGTPVGDPIEIRALTQAFRTQTQRMGYCAIGSVKTNVGHLDAAAGMAGVIKAVLALKHRQLPPSLHFTHPNPEIDFASSPFYVNAQLRPWTSSGPLRAGVMATGMGGTNAHVVLEEAPAPAAASVAPSPQLLVLSAKTPSALEAATLRLRDALQRSDVVNLQDAAFTLQAGRKAFPCRRFVVCSERDAAVAALGGAGPKRLVSGEARADERPIVFLLPGMGDHYVGMAHDLYSGMPAFRDEVDRCARILEPLLGEDIRKILYPAGNGWKSRIEAPGIDMKRMLGRVPPELEDAYARKLNETRYAQPAQFVVEYALARMWMELGIAPRALVGHSMGEYVAACLAEVFSLEDALRLIVRRTQLVAQLPTAPMLAVALSEEDLLPMLPTEVSICLINGPRLCVVAGSPEPMKRLESTLTASGTICRSVRNSHAFHSRMLDAMVPAYEAEVRKVRLKEPRLPLVSNVTGSWITKSQATSPAYWASHTNQTARFSDGLRSLWALGDPVLIEAGPGKTIGMLAMQHPARNSAVTPTVIASLRHHYENRNDVEFLLENIGLLWASGEKVRWEGLHRLQHARKVPLPAYPFEKQRFWLGTVEPEATHGPASSPALASSTGIDGGFYAPVWERSPHAVPSWKPERAKEADWLILADRWGGGGVLRRELQRHGASVHFVRFGSRFARRSDGSVEIDPSVGDDYLRLLREIALNQTRPLNIVHLGCISSDGTLQLETQPHQPDDLGFFSLVHLAQAIYATGITTQIRIGVVSSQLHDVTGVEELDPSMATVLGPIKVLPQEFPNIACFNVDLGTGGDFDNCSADTTSRVLAEYLESEPVAAIAYRGRHRWTRSFRSQTLPSPGAATQEMGGVAPARLLRKRGVYLITGGTGGLGFALAEYLARTCEARLVLTRKSPFPESSTRHGAPVSQGSSVADAGIFERVRELEGLGAEVEMISADVADADQMRRVFERTLHRFQALNGVFHAAGTVKPRLVRDMSRQSVAGVLSPKVQGTRLLFDLMRETSPDFLVLFSSMSSVIPAYGHADYSGANSFLDAFAAYANARSSFRTVSINWPVWKEVGIGVGSTYFSELEALLGVADLQEEMLKRAIRTSDGIAALMRALDSALPQVVVCPEGLDRLAERARLAPPALRTGAVSDGAAAASIEGRRPREGGNLPEDEIEQEVARVWAEVFGHGRLGMDTAFSDLGGHSLIAMQIVARVRSHYRIALSLKDFFSAPTISALSALVKEKILREIDAMSDDEARRQASLLSAGQSPQARHEHL